MGEQKSPRIICGRELSAALVEAGVIAPDEKITRLVIDIPVMEPVRIYVERIGDERLLKVSSSLKGVQIESIPAPKAGD